MALLLQRYIFWLLLKNFLVLVVVVTGLLLTMATVQALERLSELSFGHLLTRIPYLLPRLLSYSIPISMLISTLITFGRLSADNEVLAIRMAGIHPLNAVTPAIVLGLLLSLVTLHLNSTLAPLGEAKARTITKGDLRRFLGSLEETGALSFSSETLEMSWERVSDDNALVGVSFDLRPSAETRIRGEASRAFIRKDEDREVLEFEFVDCDIIVGDGADRHHSARQRFEYPFASLFAGGGDSSLRKLLSSRELSYRMERDPALGRLGTLRITSYRVEFWRRYFLAFSCLVFALVGSPVGILFRKGSFVGSALVALVLAFGLFYPLQEAGKSLAYQMVIPPMLAMALPDIVLCVIGIILMVRVFSR